MQNLHVPIYIYIYIYICVCVCVCVYALEYVFLFVYVCVYKVYSKSIATESAFTNVEMNIEQGYRK